MERNDDLWLKQWKEVLDDFEEEVPVDGWEKLQADLQANEPVGQEETPKSAKVIPFRRWQVAAAAAVVVLVAGAGIWFLASDQTPQVPVVDDPIAQILQTETPNNNGVGEQIPQTIQEETDTEEETIEEKPENTPATKVVEQKAPVTQPVEKAKPAETKPAKAEEIQQPEVVQSPEPEKITQQEESKTEVAETKRQGTPIQVKNSARDQRQRSTTPTYAGERQTNTEVNVVNRRKQIQITNNPALQNVPLLKDGEATTRSMASEITDMDRVFNSFMAHFDEYYNQSEHLFDNGTGVYSTVDNALFMAGLVKKMQGQRSNDDVKLYREMASRLVNLQQSNGLWKENLLNTSSRNADIDADSYICYVLAWGINNGVLNRNQYLESVRRAWQAIGNCQSEACQLAAQEIKKL